MNNISRKAVCILFAITFFISGCMSGCGNRELPATTNEQHLSGITVENAGIITDGVIDVYQEPDILSRRITQVLFNQVVNVLREEAAWAEIKLLDGTSGWVRSKYLTRDIKSVIDGSINNRIIVTAKSVDIYTATNSRIKYKQVVLGTELYSYEKTSTGYNVLLPGNVKGWVQEGGVIAVPIEEQLIPRTTSANFVETLNKFKGTIYIIGGMSRWGIDSPGLVYICARINGADIPRNMADMIKAGIPVEYERMEAGDLIFFGTDSENEDVNDVGVYLGEEQFIHSSTTKGVVEDSLEDTYFKDRIIGIRRIF